MRTVCRVKTPVGVLTAIYDKYPNDATRHRGPRNNPTDTRVGGDPRNDTIRRVVFPGEPFTVPNLPADDSLPFATEVTEYFAGRRKAFSLPMFIPGTSFRQDVYRAVLAIPYGETATYSDVAAAAGYPLAMRAVGSAMKANPLPLLIPCHRVVHKAKNKSAYRPGLPVKEFLLRLERENS